MQGPSDIKRYPSNSYLLRFMHIPLVILCALIPSAYTDDMFKDIKDLLWTNSTAAIQLATADDIRSFIAQNYSLVYFGTYGCKNCDHLEANLIGLAEERNQYNQKGPDHHLYLPIGIVNVHHHPELAREFKVHRVPTLRLYHEGLYRTIPQGEAHKGFIEQFVEQRIHLKKLPEIYNADRLDEVIKNVPHALVWVGDGAHKVDQAAKKLLRYLQFSLSHFHFYLMRDGNLAREHNLMLHSLYEVNSFDRQWKRIDVHAVIHDASTEVDMTHLHAIKKKVLMIAHPKVQMLDLIFMQKYGLEDVLLFFSKNKSGDLKDNKRLEIFNDTCHSHLYLHTRCVIFCEDATRDMAGITHIFHLPVDSLETDSIMHLHSHNFRRETFILSPKEALTDQSLLDFYHQSHSRKWRQHHVKSKGSAPVAEGFGVLSAENRFSLQENKFDVVLLTWDSTNPLHREKMEQVVEKINLARKVIGEKMPDWDIQNWTFDYGTNSHEYFVEAKWAVWYCRSWEGPGAHVPLNDVDFSILAQQVTFLIESANSW